MNRTDDRAARWMLSGRVQGVGFRWFVQRHADRLGLRGHVTNLPDGRVEVVARGDASAIAELGQALNRGPMAARVESVDKSEIPHESVDDKAFKIK